MNYVKSWVSCAPPWLLTRSIPSGLSCVRRNLPLSGASKRVYPSTSFNTRLASLPEGHHDDFYRRNARAGPSTAADIVFAIILLERSSLGYQLTTQFQALLLTTATLNSRAPAGTAFDLRSGHRQLLQRPIGV